MPLELDPAWVEKMRAGLPELPDAKKARFVADYGLSAYEPGCWSPSGPPPNISRRSPKGRDPKAAANWVMGDLFGALNKKGLGIEARRSRGALGALIDLISDGTISGRIAKDVFAEMVETGADAGAIVEAKGLRQVTRHRRDRGRSRCRARRQPGPGRAIRQQPKVLGFFVGQVMKATQGKANPALVNELLSKKLGADPRLRVLGSLSSIGRTWPINAVIPGHVEERDPEPMNTGNCLIKRGRLRSWRG